MKYARQAATWLRMNVTCLELVWLELCSGVKVRWELAVLQMVYGVHAHSVLKFQQVI
jgi:hypothetical protein